MTFIRPKSKFIKSIIIIIYFGINIIIIILPFTFKDYTFKYFNSFNDIL